MPGSTPPTSQLDWLSSTTAMIVLSWSKATRDLLKSFSWGITALRQLFASDDGAISSSPAPYHLSVPPGIGTAPSRLSRARKDAGRLGTAVLFTAGPRDAMGRAARKWHHRRWIQHGVPRCPSRTT